MKILVILATLAMSVNSRAGPDEISDIRQSLQSLLPDMKVDKVEETAVPGLYSVLIGAEVLYITADGQFLLKGDMIDIPNRKNLSEQKRTVARRAILKKIPEDEFISFSPEKVDHTIYVFTDVTCPFCQKLQHDIAEINAMGIAVKYLAFPREGVPSPTSRKMESVWCSKDRQTAFVDAMIGLDVDEVDCKNPVDQHFNLGQTMGVRGTPAIYTEDGRYLSGYMPPADLLKALRKK